MTELDQGRGAKYGVLPTPEEPKYLLLAVILYQSPPVALQHGCRVNCNKKKKKTDEPQPE